MKLQRPSSTLGGERASKAIYGIILISVTLIGLKAHDTDPMAIAVKIFVAAMAIVVAEVYSEILGESIRHQKALNSEERRTIVYNAMAIATVSLYPIIVFLLSKLGLYSVDTAFTIALVLNMLGLAAFGYYAIKSSGATKHQALVKGSILAGIGLIIVIAKFTVGH